jgi:hypothetical protein
VAAEREAVVAVTVVEFEAEAGMAVEAELVVEVVADGLAPRPIWWRCARQQWNSFKAWQN